MRSVRRNDIMVTGNNVRAVNVNHAVVVNDDALTVFQRTCITVRTDGAYYSAAAGCRRAIADHGVTASWFVAVLYSRWSETQSCTPD